MSVHENVSRSIPEAIKKQVRQACRFGCVICGLPVYHYDHIENFADVREHVAENIALLCPSHHQDKTSRRLPAETVRLARANPANGRSDFTTAYRWFFAGSTVAIEVGSSRFGNVLSEGETFSAVQIDGEDLVGFSREEDALLLNLALKTAANSRKTVHVDRGELRIDTGVDDAKLEGPKLSVIPKRQGIPVVVLKTDSGLKIASGLFFGIRAALRVYPDTTRILPGGTEFRGGTTFGGRVGLAIGLPHDQVVERPLAKTAEKSSERRKVVKRVARANLRERRRMFSPRGSK